MNKPVLDDRKNQIGTAGTNAPTLACGKASLAGSVSQRACVFCGSRVVLYPIADAVHLVHGPIGCAAYTWDIRGALSSGPELHRLSFSSDLQEQDVIFGGEPKLFRALMLIIKEYQPKAAFVYATSIVGVIGDDVDAICKKVAAATGIPVIPVHSEGFKGTKKDGYRAACEALLSLVGQEPLSPRVISSPFTMNILGEFNLAGEAWMLKQYYQQMGVEVIATLTGDGRVDDVRRSNQAALNVVQCSGSMTWLAKEMEKRYQIPYMKVSYFGIEDMAEALYAVARHFMDHPPPGVPLSDCRALMERTKTLVKTEIQQLGQEIALLRQDLHGKRAAIYVGGAFKSHSLVKALRLLGMRTVLVGSQTGSTEDYQALQSLCDPGTIIVDDSNPVELSRFILEQQADLFIGGVKERPLAYKLGIAFCDHNHERKTALAGFAGMINFAREVHRSVMSPVWQFAPRQRRKDHASPEIINSHTIQAGHNASTTRKGDNTP
jgi:nitrogenase molybdenum-cofactor synthesis protein NifE